MKRNFGFLAVNSKEITGCIINCIDEIKKLNTNCDISLFSNAHCSNALRVGVFGYPELWYFNGTLIVFTDKDLEYATSLNQNMNIMFMFVGQKVQLLNMMRCMSKHDVDIITIAGDQNNSLFKDCYRILGVKPKTFKEILSC
jgi:hypothetical protein